MNIAMIDIFFISRDFVLSRKIPLFLRGRGVFLDELFRFCALSRKKAGYFSGQHSSVITNERKNRNK